MVGWCDKGWWGGVIRMVGIRDGRLVCGVG